MPISRQDPAQDPRTVTSSGISQATLLYFANPGFGPESSRWREFIDQIIEDKMSSLFDEQAAAEFHTSKQ
ncbi:hypothetical protein [Arthrobacter sp. UYCu723]